MLTQEQLDHMNARLLALSPQEILEWAYVTFPRLFQTTAFGLTGLVTVDMVLKLEKKFSGAETGSSGKPEAADASEVTKHPIDLIFIDTLYHFPQTYDLVAKIIEKYGAKIHTFTPMNVATEEEFAERYGDQLWESNDLYYDYLVKVEPAQRAYKQLNVAAVLTGRRRLQGGARGLLPVVEIEAASGIIKINPLCNWDFAQVKQYVDAHGVPYNELLDVGYKSVGDWHSTVPVAEGEDERSGRWKDQAKTECGIHETSKYAQFLAQQK